MPGTTPVYGFPYPEPTDLVADYPALGQDLAEDIEAVLPTIGGLATAKPTSIANSGGSASLSGNTVTFSGVSSVSLNGCFTGTYDNYRVVIAVPTTTANDTLITMRFRVSGTDSSTGYYWTRWTVVSNNTTAAAVGSNAAQFVPIITGDTGRLAISSIDVGLPFTTNRSTITWTFATMTGAVSYSSHGGGTHDVSTAYDGFTLAIGSGTITGTVSVFGYRK